MKKLEQIKLDNFKEQYRVLLRDIQQVNSELEIAIKSRDSVQGELRICEGNLKGAQSDLSQTIAQTTEVDKASDNKRKGIEKEEREIKLLLENTNRDIEKLLLKKDKEISKLVNSIILLNKDLSDLQKQYDILFKGSETLEDIYTTMLSDKEILDRSLNKKRDELNSLENKISEEETKFEKNKKKVEKELEEAKNQIKSEQAKSGLAEKNLIVREKDIERKETDIRIHTRRLNELYQKIRPGIRLKI